MQPRLSRKPDVRRTWSSFAILPRMAQSQSPSDADMEKLKRELRKRLSRVCEGWAASDFEALIEDVAETELRYRDPSKAPRK
jgi:hypothetical protein